MGFIEKYMEYASKLTDAPIEYHQFVGYSILSSAMENQIFFRFGHQKVYPNLWIILIAPSSLYRKSTCISIGANILKGYKSSLIFPTEFTQEKIIEILAERPQGLFIHYEFMSLMGLLSKDYMSGTKAFLTEMYDSPPVYERQTKTKSYTIINPCISILSATTIEWFLDHAKEGDFRGGFLPRFLFIPALKRSSSIYFPPASDPEEEENLSYMLKAIANGVKGEARFDDKVQKEFQNWAIKYESRITGDSGSIIVGFYPRLEICALKFAVLIEASRKHSLSVSVESIREATHIIDFLTTKLEVICMNDLTFSIFQKERKRVINLISGAGDRGISKKELIQKVRLPSNKLSEVLNSLMEEEKIIVKSIRGKTKPVTSFFLVKEDGEMKE